MSTGMELAWRCWLAAMVAAILGALAVFWAQGMFHWTLWPSLIMGIVVFMVTAFVGMLLNVDGTLGL